MVIQTHSGDPLQEADRRAVAGADKESDDKDTLHPGGRGQELVFDDADTSKPHTWCPTVKTRIKAHWRREDVMAN